MVYSYVVYQRYIASYFFVQYTATWCGIAAIEFVVARQPVSIGEVISKVVEEVFMVVHYHKGYNIAYQYQYIALHWQRIPLHICPVSGHFEVQV